MEVPWPWRPTRWDIRENIEGLEELLDFAATFDAPFVTSVDDAKLATSTLCAGFPVFLPIRPRWTRENRNKLCLSVTYRAHDKKEYGIHWSLLATQPGLTVQCGAYYLPEGLQARGLASRLIKSCFQLFDQWKVEFLEIHAVEKGAYAWGRYGAAASECQMHRQRLRERIDRMRREGNLTHWSALRLKMIVKFSSDMELMWRVAKFRRITGDRPGRVLLMYYDWNGYWDLRDPKHRELVVRAMPKDDGRDFSHQSKL